MRFFREVNGIEINRIYNEDCLEGMKRLEDASVAMVLCDPPYNIGKAAWDNIENYVDWCGAWIKECERILKPTGTFVFWHNDLVQTSELVCWINKNTGFTFNSFGLWHKPYFRPLSWANRAGNFTGRSFFNIFEWFVSFNKLGNSATGLERVYSNPACFKPLKEWYEGEKTRLGLTNKDIGEYYTKVTGRKPYMPLHHYFKDSQFEMPTQAVWDAVYVPLGFAKTYEALRAEYEALRPRFNVLAGAPYCNYFRDDEEKAKMGKTLRHPCEKPLNIFERLVQTYTNEGETVLDCFAGSGTTAVACVNTGRNYICFETDAGYCEIAEKRLAELK